MRVLVVGGTSGLGFELAKLHRDLGHEVTVVGRRKLDEPGIDSIQADVTRILPHQLEIDYPVVPTDRLIWAAGFSKPGFIDEHSNTDIEMSVLLHLTRCAQLVQYLLRSQPTLPSLIAITSTSGYVPRAREPVYAAAKAGLSMLLRSLALDARVGQVLEVAPAGMRTPFWDLTDESDRSSFLDAGWVANETMTLLVEGQFEYCVAKILREPPRVEVMERQ